MLPIDRIVAALPHALLATDLDLPGERVQGKVRDLYLLDGLRMLIATDRISAFDHVLGTVPYRGQVLNELSAWWFEQTADIVANHLVEVIDPNVSVGREAEALPVEVVVRGYITGVTDTALWTLYQQGVERPYGLDLPEGLHKNDVLPEAVITPTTKGGPGEHDERLSEVEVLERGLVTPSRWEEVRRVALQLFERGQTLAERGGLVLVDTKYEFGLIDDELVLIDEVHTPDSSRFWTTESWLDCRGTDKEPEGFSKEFLRLWFVHQGFKGDGDVPELPPELLALASQRYQAVYEKLSGKTFDAAVLPATERIQQAAAKWQARSAG